MPTVPLLRFTLCSNLRMKVRLFVLPVLWAIWFAACSFNTPSVVLPKTQRLYSYNRHGVLVERLAVFVLFEDADGRNDYKELALQEKATGLRWTIQRENTVFLQEARYSQNAQWVGSNKFIYPRRFFPEGGYTLTVFDLAGNKVETDFTLPPAQPITAEPLTCVIENGQWQVQTVNASVCSSLSLILLTADLQPLSVRPLQHADQNLQSGAVDELQQSAPDARYLQCLGENAEQTVGFLTAPVLLSPQ